MSSSELENQFLKAYDDYADAIFRHCYFRLRNREAAKDACQETFMRAWQYMNSGAKVTNIRALLYRTASNLIIDGYRKKKELSLDDLTGDGFMPAAESANDLGFGVKMIYKAINELDRNDRDLVRLRYVDELSIKEIAEIVEKNENAVSVALHRAISKLRKVIKP